MSLLRQLQEQNFLVSPERPPTDRCYIDYGRLTLIHTHECLQHNSLEVAAQKEYDRRFPRYCRHCNATGMEPQPTPSRCPMNCLRCSWKGRCPRCGKRALYDAYLKCTACRWDPGSGARPQVHGCSLDSTYELLIARAVQRGALSMADYRRLLPRSQRH